MRFSRDRRGQSVVVGTVILFGFLIVALGVYQVQVVPTENANVEFEHSQAVEDDFGDLRNDVLRAGATGSTGSTQIQLGTRYPARTFFINPPPVSGSLETEPTGEIRVQNATVGDGAHRNARDFWNTSPSFATRSLRYEADYNEFDGAPELVYEHSVVAAEFEDAVLLRTGQTVVSDGRISLTALTGSVSESGVEPQSVDPRAVSVSDTTVPLEPTGGNVTLELPTAVANASRLADRWNQALPAGATAMPNATGDAVRITLANGSDPYRLALSEVSLDATGETEPAYVVPVGSDSAAVGETVTVEVRDRYNNPVPDATVSFEGTTDNISITNETGDDGRVYFDPTASGLLNASVNGTDGPDYESVSFDVSEAGRGEPIGRTFNVSWDRPDITLNTDETVSGTVNVDGDPLDNATVDFATTNPNVVEVANTSAITQQGSFSEQLITGSEGNATVFAASGDDVDRLNVTVTGSPVPVPFGVFVQGEGSLGRNGDIDADFEVDSGSEVYSFDVNVDRRGNSGNYDGTVIIDGGAFNNEELTLTRAAAGDLGTGDEIDLLDPDIYDSVNEGGLQSISEQLDSDSTVESLNNGGSVDLEQPDVREQ